MIKLSVDKGREEKEENMLSGEEGAERRFYGVLITVRQSFHNYFEIFFRLIVFSVFFSKTIVKKVFFHIECVF